MNRMTEQTYSENSSLVSGLRERAPEALRELWSRYENRLYACCSHILGGGPDARDVTWDVLVDFSSKYVETLSKPEALSSFLHIMAVRRSLRLRKSLGRYDEFEDGMPGASEDTPDLQAELRRLSTPLNQCFKKLSPKTRQAMRLKFQYGLSHADIASMLGVSKTIVSRLTQKGLDLLRRCILKRLNASRRLTGGGSKRCSVDPPTVARLIALARRVAPKECVHLEAAALYLDGRLSGTTVSVRRVEALCDECTAAVRALEEVWRIDDRPKRTVETKSDSVLGTWKIAALAAGIVAAVLSGLLVREHLRVTGEGQSAQTLRIKGQADRIAVTVKRGDAVFALRPMDRLLKNDRIDLRYCAEKSGYLIVLSIDEQLHASTLYPAGNTDGAVDAGIEQRLTAGGTVQGGEGCEWIVGVFSDAPLEPQRVISAVKQSALDGPSERCDLKLVIPGARSVFILPVTR